MKNILSLFIFSLLLSPPTTKAAEILDTKLVETYVDSTYSEGDTAILRTQFFSRPDNRDLEFDIVSKINGVEQPVTRVSNFELFSTLKNLAIGTYFWEVQAVLQNSRLAKDLRDANESYLQRIAEIDLELEETTDPGEIADLEAERANLVELSQAVQDQLSQIRIPFLSPITKTFIVE